MRILLIGASGLIGSAVAARLKRDGHEIVAVGRGGGPAARRVPVDRWLFLDLRGVTTPQAWRPHLAGIEAVVNCAGVLQDSSRDSPGRVHRDMPLALWAACQAAGVRRVVHFSALGVDRGGITPFSSTKREGDDALAASDLDWVILRPSVVVGGPAYGGSALFRALASLPVLPLPPRAGAVDVVQLDDVAETVARLIGPNSPSRVALDLAGPDRLAFADIVAAYRGWLGWTPAKSFTAPGWLMGLAYRFGDALAWLGWRPPVRSTPGREIRRGATGDNAPWRRVTGIEPRSLAAALAASPASVQDRWFSRLYLLKPLAIGTFALFWVLTGLISLGPGYQRATHYMLAGGGGALSEPSVIAGAVADIAVGCAIAWRPTAKLGLWAALGLSAFYVAAGTILLPGLWSDPLGPMMKIWPILALNLLCLAILDER
ncbi:MAG TPA: SDR family oxidoreductase [Allosphingosinicella sp.]|nr:SDR family oxidoreductase [Allosphingosinicella sp.]